MVNPLGYSLDGDSPELEQHRTGRGVDEIATYRDLHHGPIGFGNRHETWGVWSAEFAERDPVYRANLARVRIDVGLTSHPDHYRSDHVSRAGGVVIEGPDQRLRSDLEPELLVQLPKRSIKRGLSGFDASPRKGPLAGVGAHGRGPPREDHRRSSGGACDATVQAEPLCAGNGRQLGGGCGERIVPVDDGVAIDDHDRYGRMAAPIQWLL